MHVLLYGIAYHREDYTAQAYINDGILKLTGLAWVMLARLEEHKDVPILTGCRNPLR